MARRRALLMITTVIAAWSFAAASAQGAKAGVRLSLRSAIAHAFQGVSRAQRATLISAAARLRPGTQARLARRLRSVPSNQVPFGVGMLEAELARLTRAQQHAVLASLLGAATRAQRARVSALARAGASSLEQFISSAATQSYNAFPGDVPAMVASCLTLSSEFSYYATPSPAACTGGLTSDNHAFLDARNAQTVDDMAALADTALAKAPAGLVPALAANDITYIRRNFTLGDFFLGVLALRRVRSDPQLSQAISASIYYCYTNAGFYPCTDDEVQLALLGFAASGNGTLPLPQFLAQDFADCLLSVCSAQEQSAVEQYLAKEEQLNAQFQQMIAQMQETTRTVAEGWIQALGPA